MTSGVDLTLNTMFAETRKMMYSVTKIVIAPATIARVYKEYVKSRLSSVVF